MQPFEPRTLVNGRTLRDFNGKNVSIMLRVEEETSRNLVGTSTDDVRVRVNLPEPTGARKGNWVEVIGTSVGGDAVRGKEAILFSDDNINFDTEGYNMLVLYTNNAKDIFRSG